ncbi:MAG: hypothetical protein Q8O03_01765 [Nanoarchaeota archaeon]|nr:hypothetical protein [Nanoarchaeota archaeon]
MKKRAIVLVGLLFLINLWFVSATGDFEFNGTVHNVDGAALSGSNVSITIRGADFNTIAGFESNLTGTDGWFTINLTADATYMYQAAITHYNETDSSVVEYIGASLPAFPYQAFVHAARTNFYLKQAGTINITAVNSTGDRIDFNYQIKDTKLGYPIGGGWTTPITEAVVYVPTDRNYSLMVYPQNSLPVGFEWTNFSSTDDYTVNDGSVYYTYNGTTRTMAKQFNCSETLARLTGYVNVTGLDGWEELIVVPYLLESGNMTHATYGTLPYNMSSWAKDDTFGFPLNETDYFNLTTGFYNITLPEPAESATYLLFATAKNGTYYGGFKSITLSYGETLPETNFTHVYGLLGDDYSNITLHSAQDWSDYKASTVQQSLLFVNSSNDSISGLSGHIEVKVDYSSYDAMEVTYMVETSQQSGSANFSLPLLNVTGIKKMNVYSQMYAPRKLTLTVDQIQANNNITLQTFNPGQIDAAEDKGGAETSMAFYISNSTCDIPQPGSGCVIGDLDEDNFDPISAVMGGGKISFRMGYGDVKIHYVNVDLLASGPPDAAFDSSPNQTAAGTTFDAALRFGSGGPSIYDYILVSTPYSETAGSGLDDSQQVNMSLPVLYDDDWNVIWNATENGTAGSDLAANNSYYSTYQTDWESLMNVSTCVTNYSSEWFNTTSPCYIDTANNTVWIRLPHFSGTGPSVKGTTTAAATTATTTSSGSTSTGQGGYAPVDVSEGIVRTMSIKDAVVVSLGEQGGGSAGGEVSHQIVLNKLTSDSVTLLIYSNPLEVTLKVSESKKVDVDADGVLDILIELRSIDVPHQKADIYFEDITPMKEAAPPAEEAEEESAEEKPEVPTGEEPSVPEEVSSKAWLWILLIAVLVVVGVGYWFTKKK